MNRSTRTILFAILAACSTTLAACGSSSDGETPAQPPAAPTGFTVSAGNSAVDLAWTASSGATSYTVYRGQSTGALSTKAAIATVTVGVAYTDTAVANGTTYYYQVTATGAAGESAGSTELSATPSATSPPIAPTGVTATAALGQVTLAWSVVPSATSYTVYWKTSPGVTTADGSYTSATNGYVDSGLINGTTYYYRVSASNANGPSPLSAEVSATPNAPLPFIEATAIRWTAPIPLNVPIVEVRVCTDSTCSTTVGDATVTVNATAVPWNAGRGAYAASLSLASGSPVSLSVSVPAGSAVAQGVYTATGTMYASPPTVTAPTSGATWVRTGDNVVTWTHGTPTGTTPASQYVVGIQNASGTFYPVNANGSPSTAEITATSFTLPAGTLPTAGSYSVFVGIGTQGITGNTGGGIAIAGAAAGSGLYLGSCSPTVSVDVTSAPPAPPTGLVATGGDQSVALAWNGSTGATSYKVYRGTASGALGTKTQIAVVSVGVTHTDTNVTNGTTYYYQVVATNGNGDSPGSVEASATPVAGLPPPFIEATSIRWTLPMISGVPIQQARICTDPTCMTVVSDATVTMNTSTLTFNPTNGDYEGNVMPAAGGSVTLTVTIPAGSVAAAGTYTATIATYSTAPTVTMPTTSTTWSRTVAHDLTWSPGAPTATTPASVYVVGINDSAGNFFPVKVNEGPTEVPISSTTFTLPANTLPAAGTYVAWIGIGTTGIVDGGSGVAIPGAAAGSGLHTGYVSTYVAFTVTD